MEKLHFISHAGFELLWCLLASYCLSFVFSNIENENNNSDPHYRTVVGIMQKMNVNYFENLKHTIRLDLTAFLAHIQQG